MDENLLPLWQSMTTEEVGALARRDPVIILSTAAIEQHGPHLPLSTDLDIGGGLLARAFQELPSDFPARVLPRQAIGASLEHTRFPGTLSLPSETLGALIHSIGRAVARCGMRRLLVHNSHGGNRHVVEAAGLALREKYGLLVVKTNYADHPLPDEIRLPDRERRRGLHGGAIETAMMLHLRPDLVRPDAIGRAGDAAGGADSGGGLAPEGAASFSWMASDLHPSGVAGDPRLADASMGKALVDHYGTILATVIREAHSFPLASPGDRAEGRGPLEPGPLSPLDPA